MGNIRNYANASYSIPKALQRTLITGLVLLGVCDASAAEHAAPPVKAESHIQQASTRKVDKPLCPPEMAAVPGSQGTFCVDRWEASLVRLTAEGSKAWPGNQPIDGIEREFKAVSRAGAKPQGYISGAQAAMACEQAGKRLCTSSEFTTACRGPKRTRYPYGDERRASACNDRTDKVEMHPVLRLFQQHAVRNANPQAMWQARWMNDPRLHELSQTVAPTGSFLECSNDYGISDMVGNLHEWIADPNGTFAGGYFKDTVLNGEGCDYRTTAHTFEYHDYSTGFRCCSDTE